MPRYEMKCPGCGYEADVLCSFEASDDVRCTVCQHMMDRKMSTASFKGLPTPKHHGVVPLDQDPQFKKDWAEVYKDDAWGVPGEGG